MKVNLIPLYISFKNNKTPIQYISIPHLKRWDGAVHIIGDNMYPLLKTGDVIFYTTVNISEIAWGEMYILKINLNDDEYITVKYLHQSELPGHVILDMKIKTTKIKK